MSNRPGYHDAGGLPFRRRASADYRGIDLSTQVVPPEPHPETGAAVRRLHLWLVESAVHFHGTDAAAISDAVMLPVWNVRRALHTLKLAGDPRETTAERRAVYGSRVKVVHAYLAKHGPTTTPDLARACGFPGGSLGQVLKTHPGLFRAAGLVRTEEGWGKAAMRWEAISVVASQGVA
jgi:hypothetical protein